MNNHMLSLWNDGLAKRQIIEFVENVTSEGSGSFVPPQDRIATFDNDGTLWSEKPTYFQLIFALDQIKLMFPDHPEWRDRRIGTFSKGMRQRIGILQALLHQPAILFLDEPASGLDPEGQRDIGNLIVRLNREFGITIFMNTHQLSEAAKLCTSIGIMNHGRLVIADTLANVMIKFPDAPSLEEIYLHVEQHESQNGRSPILQGA